MKSKPVYEDEMYQQGQDQALRNVRYGLSLFGVPGTQKIADPTTQAQWEEYARQSGVKSIDPNLSNGEWMANIMAGQAGAASAMKQAGYGTPEEIFQGEGGIKNALRLMMRYGTPTQMGKTDPIDLNAILAARSNPMFSRLTRAPYIADSFSPGGANWNPGAVWDTTRSTPFDYQGSGRGGWNPSGLDVGDGINRGWNPPLPGTDAPSRGWGGQAPDQSGGRQWGLPGTPRVEPPPVNPTPITPLPGYPRQEPGPVNPSPIYGQRTENPGVNRTPMGFFQRLYNRWGLGQQNMGTRRY